MTNLELLAMIDLEREMFIDNCEFDLDGTELCASVYLTVSVDNDYDLSHLSPASRHAMERKIAAGDLMCVTLSVKAEFKGLSGTDHLGRVFITPNEPLKDIIQEYLKDYQMEQNAIGDLEFNLRALKKALCHS